MENLLALADSCSQDTPDFSSKPLPANPSSSFPRTTSTSKPQFQSPKLHPMDPPPQVATKQVIRRPQNTTNNLSPNHSSSSLPPPQPAQTQSVPQASLRPKPSMPSPKPPSPSAVVPVTSNSQTVRFSLFQIVFYLLILIQTPSSSKATTPSSQNSKFTYPESLKKGLKRRRASTTTANNVGKQFIPPRARTPSTDAVQPPNETPTNAAPMISNNVSLVYSFALLLEN